MDGLPLARHRHVVMRLFRVATPFAVLDARFADLSAVAVPPGLLWPGHRAFFRDAGQ